MTIIMARRVLLIGLLLILPIPFYLEHWAWLPVAKQLAIAMPLLLVEFNVSHLLLFLQGLSGILICWVLALGYTICSANWPAAIRSSMVGLMLLTSLIIFSSVKIYRSLESPSLSLSFMQIY